MAIYFHNSEVIIIITSGVKMVSIKTSRDVGMVLLSSSCMEKPTGGKSIGTRRGHIRQLQSLLDTHFTIGLGYRDIDYRA